MTRQLCIGQVLLNSIMRSNLVYCLNKFSKINIITRQVFRFPKELLLDFLLPDEDLLLPGEDLLLVEEDLLLPEELLLEGLTSGSNTHVDSAKIMK